MSGAYILLVVLLLIMVGVYIFQKMHPGDWGTTSDPDADAEIVEIISTFKNRSSLNRYYETEVKFSDGYVYVTRKTNVGSYNPPFSTPWTIGTKYSIDDALQKEIIADAKKAHKQAVEKEIRNRGINVVSQASKEDSAIGKIENTAAEKTERMYKCEICGKEANKLIPAVLVDNMGKRHREVCTNCFVKYGCKEE
ncbi:MAG: hypothetical protein IKG23_02470 [Clostridia bacterium]|nr:hypothetical protein [Clostridia bacterium]